MLKVEKDELEPIHMDKSDKTKTIPTLEKPYGLNDVKVKDFIRNWIQAKSKSPNPEPEPKTKH